MTDTLFSDTAAMDRSERPEASIVRALESFGYRAEAVRLWTREKASTTLYRCKKEEAIALRRAAAAAVAVDGTAQRGQVSELERRVAADSLSQALALGSDEVLQSVAASVYCLTDAELKELAGYLVRLYRGQARVRRIQT